MCKFPENFLVTILAFEYEIREIKSARTRVDENLSPISFQINWPITWTVG